MSDFFINLNSFILNDFTNGIFIDGIYLLCVGEIYNYRQISPKSKSEYESIIHYYNHYDIEYTLNMLDGDFSFVLYDTIKKIFIVARDPYGVKPLYQHDLTFSSSFNKNFKDFNEIKQFEPGTYNIYSVDSLTLIKSKCYTSFGFSKMIFNNQFDIYGIIYQLLVNSVKKRIDKSKNNVCLLSGGLDSSLIAGILKKFIPNLETYTVGLENSEDLIYARKVADHLKTNHTEIIITKQEFLEIKQKFFDIKITDENYEIKDSNVFIHKLKHISGNVFVGCGANELTGGYTHFKNYTNENDFDYECKRLLNCIHLNLPNYSDLKFPFLDRSLIQTYLSILPEIRSHVFNNQPDKFLLRATFEFIDKDIIPIEVLTRSKLI